MDAQTVKKLIGLVRKSQDKQAKDSLLFEYYNDGCKWASKQVSKVLYSDLIAPEQGEIKSLVYQAFEKALDTFKLEGTHNLSFKNYFYLMIRYQIYAEFRGTLSYRVIKGYDEEREACLAEIKNSVHAEFEIDSKLDNEIKVESIIQFLKGKSPEYANIIRLKLDGYKNNEICKELKLSPISLKARLQYIKRLVLARFVSLDGVF